MTAFFGHREFLSCAASMNGPPLCRGYWPIDRSDARTNWLSSRAKDTSSKRGIKPPREVPRADS